LRQPKWLRHMQQAQTATLFREMRQLQEKRYRAVSDYWTSRRRLMGAPYTTSAISTDSSGQVATLSAKVRASQPTVTVKPAVKSTKIHRGF